MAKSRESGKVRRKVTDWLTVRLQKLSVLWVERPRGHTDCELWVSWVGTDNNRERRRTQCTYLQPQFCGFTVHPLQLLCWMSNVDTVRALKPKDLGFRVRVFTSPQYVIVRKKSSNKHWNTATWKLKFETGNRILRGRTMAQWRCLSSPFFHSPVTCHHTPPVTTHSSVFLQQSFHCRSLSSCQRTIRRSIASWEVDLHSATGSFLLSFLPSLTCNSKLWTLNFDVVHLYIWFCDFIFWVVYTWIKIVYVLLFMDINRQLKLYWVYDYVFWK